MLFLSDRQPVVIFTSAIISAIIGASIGASIGAAIWPAGRLVCVTSGAC
jgi:hypothetical protein